MAVTINWDGNSAGHLAFPVTPQMGTLVKVSDRFFSAEELNGYSIFYYNSSSSTTYDYTQESFLVDDEFTTSINYNLGSTEIPLVTSVAFDGDGFEKGTYLFSTEGPAVSPPPNYVCKLILPNAVDETKPLTEITYNGETIAQLNAGETAILKCAGLPMETDIIVKVNG